MTHAELCPVCKGLGKINEKPCHGCDGKGWITVHDVAVTYPIYPLPPMYPTYPGQPYTFVCTTPNSGNETSALG